MEKYSDIDGVCRHDIAQMLGMREKDFEYYDNDYGCRVSALRRDEESEVEVISTRKGKRRLT